MYRRLCINDIDNEAVRPEDKQEIIKRFFELISLISMYRNLVPNIVKSTQVMANGVRSRVHEIDTQTIKYHLDLLCHRNHKLNGIDKQTLTYFGYKPPKKINYEEH